LAVLFFCLVDTGGPDEHLPSTLRIYRWTRRRGGVAACGAGAAAEDAGAPDWTGKNLTVFRKGLGETGYFADRNVAIEYRWGDNQLDRLIAWIRSAS
jgi:hypothetical protein